MTTSKLETLASQASRADKVRFILYKKEGKKTLGSTLMASYKPSTILTMTELLREARELIDRAYGSDYGKEWLAKFDAWNEGK